MQLENYVYIYQKKYLFLFKTQQGIICIKHGVFHVIAILR